MRQQVQVVGCEAVGRRLVVLCASQLPNLNVFAPELPGSTQLPEGVPKDANVIAFMVDVALTPAHDSIAILFVGSRDSWMCTHCDGGGAPVWTDHKVVLSRLSMLHLCTHNYLLDLKYVPK